MLEKIRAREEAIAHENYMRKQLDEKDKQLDEKDKQLKQFPFYIYLIFLMTHVMIHIKQYIFIIGMSPNGRLPSNF